MELEIMVYKLHDKGLSLLCVLMKLLHVWRAGKVCIGKTSRKICNEGVWGEALYECVQGRCVCGTVHEEAGVPQELGCPLTLPHTQSHHVFYLYPL